MLVWTLLGTSVQCLDADALPGSESRVARASDRRTLMAITGDYRTTLLEGIVVTAQTILIAGLVLERRRRRQAERLLEQRLEFETLVSELSSRLSMVDRAERLPLITRWLPLTSAAAITVLGLAIAVRALVSAGILQIHI